MRPQGRGYGSTYLVREGRAGVPRLGPEGERGYLVKRPGKSFPGCVQRAWGGGLGQAGGRPVGLESKRVAVDAGCRTVGQAEQGLPG